MQQKTSGNMGINHRRKPNKLVVRQIKKAPRNISLPFFLAPPYVLTPFYEQLALIRCWSSRWSFCAQTFTLLGGFRDIFGVALFPLSRLEAILISKAPFLF